MSKLASLRARTADVSGHAGSRIEEQLGAGGLRSHFQAIVDLSNGEIHGYEALIRGPKSSKFQTPQALFDWAAKSNHLADLEMAACRTHARRFRQIGGRHRLFINLSPELIQSGQITSRLLHNVVNEAQLPTPQIVIELTEDFRVNDYRPLRNAVRAFRVAGFDVAIDDLGSGYSGLRQWSELNPEYVKIDRHFTKNIHRDANKRQFVHSIVEIGRTLGSLVIAEGIETSEELESVKALGVSLAQGYWFCRPTQRLPRVKHCAMLNRVRRRMRPMSAQTMASILQPNPSVDRQTTVRQAAKVFESLPNLRCLVVTQRHKAIGTLARGQILGLATNQCARELFGDRAVSDIMFADFISVSAAATLEETSEHLVHDCKELPEQDLVLTSDDGQYLGTTSLIQLLKAITQLHSRSARYTNPLTQMPGCVPTNERIDHLLLEGNKFCVARADIDDFKRINDVYGYPNGDEIIRALGRIISEELDPVDFAGHIGGDDFVLVMLSEDWEARCRGVLNRFAAEIPNHYGQGDRSQGGAQLTKRLGDARFFPVLSVSIGAAYVAPTNLVSHQEVLAIAAEAHQQAKAVSGNSLVLMKGLSGRDS